MLHSGVTVKQLIKSLFSSLSLLSLSLLLSLLFTPLRPRLPSTTHSGVLLTVALTSSFLFSLLFWMKWSLLPWVATFIAKQRTFTDNQRANKDSPAARSAAIPAQSAQPGAIIRRNSRSARPSRCFSSRCSLAPPTTAPVSPEEGDGGKERREREREGTRGPEGGDREKERRERQRKGERREGTRKGEVLYSVKVNRW